MSLPFQPVRDRLREGAFRFLTPFARPDLGRRHPFSHVVAPRPVLGQRGSLEVRLAATAKEVRRAQKLRFKVFFEEGSAISPGFMARRDADVYDAICDHLLVLDHEVTPKPFRAHKPKVVGTYRLLRQDVADRHFGFYTAGEFDIAALLESRPGLNFLELGRSCVHRNYRDKKTVELLWTGISAYMSAHRIDALIGCASLEGTDPRRLALPLSYLHHHAGSPVEWRVRALPDRYVAMDMLSAEGLDPRAAMRLLPPLVKGYLRTGATVGDGAVIDHAFGTTDVFLVMPVSDIRQRYADRFGAPAGSMATAPS